MLGNGIKESVYDQELTDGGVNRAGPSVTLLLLRVRTHGLDAWGTCPLTISMSRFLP